MFVPFTRPDITKSEEKAVLSVLRCGFITGGKVTQRFSAAIKNYTHADRCVCASSATAGLIAALLYFGVGKGDEVIVPAYTFTATAAAVSAVGACPVFADSPEGSFHIDGECIAPLITDRTKAVIPVDFGGVCCDYESIRAVCGPIPIIADSAHALGAEGCGTLADMTVVSFHAVKNLTCGEGGAVMWHMPDRDASDVESALSKILLHGLDRNSPSKVCKADYDVLFPGIKGNLPDILAAIGLSQLLRFDKMLARRREICRIYDENLPEGWTSLSHDETTSAHLYAALLPEKTDKAAVFRRFESAGIECSVHFRPLPLTTAWKNTARGAFPNAENLWRREISLPLSSVMRDEQVEYVCEVMRKIKTSP